MTEAQLQTIERELGVRLPADFRAVTQEFGDYLVEFFDEPEDVLEATRSPMAEGDYNKTNWKASYVVIGESGAGDLYLLDTEREATSPIYVLSHEDQSLTEEWASSRAFVADWQAWQARSEREYQEKAVQERQRGKHRRAFLLAFFSLLFLLAVTPMFLFLSKQHGFPVWLTLTLAVLALALLIRTMARAIRHGIHY